MFSNEGFSVSSCLHYIVGNKQIVRYKSALNVDKVETYAGIPIELKHLHRVFDVINHGVFHIVIIFIKKIQVCISSTMNNECHV